MLGGSDPGGGGLGSGAEEPIESVAGGGFAHLDHALDRAMIWPITCYGYSRMYQDICVLDGRVIVRRINALAGWVRMVDAEPAQE